MLPWALGAVVSVWSLCGLCVQVLGLIIRHSVAAFLPDATWLQTFQQNQSLLRAPICSIRNGKLVDKGKVQEVAKKDTCDPCMFVTVAVDCVLGLWLVTHDQSFTGTIQPP